MRHVQIRNVSGRDLIFLGTRSDGTKVEDIFFAGEIVRGVRESALKGIRDHIRRGFIEWEYCSDDGHPHWLKEGF